MQSEYDDVENSEGYQPPPSDFSIFFQQQMKYIPWWLLSIVIHIILLCLTYLIVVEEPPKEIKIEIKASFHQEQTEEFKPEKKRDYFKQEQKITQEMENPEVKDPVVKEAKVSDHSETANQEDFKMSKGKSDAISDSPFEGKFSSSEIGIGGGAGGMFGDRFGGKENLIARGGSQKTESAVQAGLLWLKRHQNEQGNWSATGFTQQCGRDPKYPGTCSGVGQSWTDPGLTGLALLCFLGAGNSTSIGEFKEQVKKGVKYLVDIQDSDGCFGPRSGSYMYNHAIATLAMAEAYALSEHNPMLKTSAQKGVDFLVKAQNPNMGWRYTYQSKDNDTSVTGWCVMALKSAKVGGLNVPDTSLKGAKNFLDSVTDSLYYRTGYTAVGNRASKRESMTAVAMTSRVFMGAERNDRYLIGGAGLLQTDLPIWKEDTVDYYYWYYGTLAMFQMGGDYWTNWNDKMKAALIDHQEKGGCVDGSWPPVDEWSKSGGRVYATALNVLSLEIYYRYAKVFK